MAVNQRQTSRQVEVAPVRRSSRELLGERVEVDRVTFLERRFAEPVLLGMVGRTETDAPTIRRLEPDAAVCAGAHVGTLDQRRLATGHTAAMAADPRPVLRRRARVGLSAGADDP